MARILYAWELGGDYGHVNNFLPLARALAARGHELVLALRDLSQASTLLGDLPCRLTQAPIALNQPVGLPEPQLSYADILLRHGYLQGPALRGQVLAWRQLLEWAHPDLLLADHAPTALLSARSAGVPRALFGSGFQAPPRRSPLPLMRPWITGVEKRLADADQYVLTTVNEVLSGLSLPPLHALADLLEADENFLLSLPELDHYAERGPARYWGVLAAQHNGGTTAPWPDGAGPRVFAYIKPRYRHFVRLLESLRSLPLRVLVHAPGMSEAQRRQFTNTNLHFSAAPVDMDYAATHCDFAICHAGMGTVNALLLAGKPLYLLPMQLEQSLTARNVARLGCGLASSCEDQPPDFAAMLQRLSTEQDFAREAGEFAARHAGQNAQQLLDSIVARCEELTRRAPL